MNTKYLLRIIAISSLCITSLILKSENKSCSIAQPHKAVAEAGARSLVIYTSLPDEQPLTYYGYYSKY